MAIKFEFYETPDPSGKKTGKYHARVVTHNTVTSAEVARRIHMASSLTIGDVKNVLTALGEELAEHLGQSNRVHLEGIGYFQVTLGCGEVTDPKRTHAQSVGIKTVKFRVDKALRQRLVYHTRLVRSEIKRHSAPITPDEVDRRVEAFFGTADRLTRKKLEAMCGITKSMAIRHIKRMMEEGKIENVGLRNQPIYVRVKPSQD
jgi:predicted histone-like DNA-binding protein